MFADAVAKLYIHTLVWDDGKRVKAHKDKLCRGSAGSSPSLETSDVTLVWPLQIIKGTKFVLLCFSIIFKKKHSSSSISSDYKITHIVP